MIAYTIASPNPDSRLLAIEMTITTTHHSSIVIQLPAWRPGRYELQHFAKNIQRFEVFGANETPIPFQKISKDAWQITPPVPQEGAYTQVVVRLAYYANVQNAGSSYVDEHTLYVNPVNCLPYWVDALHEPCTLQVNIPNHWQIACGLAGNDLCLGQKTLIAQNYYQLADSPLLASPYLQHDSYSVAACTFHVWFLGNYIPQWERIKADFQAFTQCQIGMMTEFPESVYHFINWILPTPYYHGVEHSHSTMIVLGPDTDAEGLYTDLLGVSSHELFHAWNICKIRPKELLPYDFTKENYFTTGFIAEGVTTFYGDIFLKRSGVFSLEMYLKELETILKRHFEKDGQAWQSLLESSYDLWLDGYATPIPNRRVSIYQKGAVVALMLDLMIREKTNHTRSLDNVMQLMWQQYGKPFVGYALSDYQHLAEEVYGDSLQSYFDECIAGNTPLQEPLNRLLQNVGLQMHTAEDGVVSLNVIAIDNENLRKWLA